MNNITGYQFSTVLGMSDGVEGSIWTSVGWSRPWHAYTECTAITRTNSTCFTAWHVGWSCAEALPASWRLFLAVFYTAGCPPLRVSV